MNLDPRRLTLLRELAALGTVTAVAGRLGYTPSAVSQQLSVLEREVGTVLLERQGRRVALTAAARALVAHSDDVLDAIERATAAAEHAAGEVTGVVDVGSTASAGATVVPHVVAALGAVCPELSVRFHHLGDGGVDELRRGHLDVWVAQHYSPLPWHDDERLADRTILREPVCLAVPTARDRGAELATYRDLPWVGGPPDSGCGRLLSRLSERAGIVPDVRHRSEDLEVILRFVAADLAVAVLPWLATARATPEVTLYPLPGVERRLVAQVRRSSSSRPVIELVLDALADAGNELSGRGTGARGVLPDVVSDPVR